MLSTFQKLFLVELRSDLMLLAKLPWFLPVTNEQTCHCGEQFVSRHDLQTVLYGLAMVITGLREG